MKTLAKILRFAFIYSFGLTAAFNVLGGAGTTCAAFLTEKFPSMSGLMDYRWLYQLFVVVTLLVGGVGIWVLIRLIRGGEKVLRNAMLVLLAGSLVGYAHMFASDTLRGKSAPANMVFYMNLITLILGLLLIIPGLKQHLDFSKRAGKAGGNLVAGAAAFISGLATISTWLWVGSTHVYQSANWVDVLKVPIVLVGGALLMLGMGLLVKGTLGDFSFQGYRRAAGTYNR
jgi:hypothetical protein